VIHRVLLSRIPQPTTSLLYFEQFHLRLADVSVVTPLITRRSFGVRNTVTVGQPHARGWTAEYGTSQYRLQTPLLKHYITEPPVCMSKIKYDVGKTCKSLHRFRNVVSALFYSYSPSRRVAHDVTQAKAKIFNMCSAHFLAEYFAEALQVFASLCKFLQHFILRVDVAYCSHSLFVTSTGHRFLSQRIYKESSVFRYVTDEF